MWNFKSGRLFLLPIIIPFKIASVQINRPASIVTGIPRISTVPPTKTIRVTKESIDAKANQENKEQLVKTRPVDGMQCFFKNI